ncbi:MAG: hypothetical protein IJ218_01825 [Alphaproteobacteria bacterium]|nr:hypothetical protein [Alphaproteobacteria bacterium]MBQ8482467.1 hypothetical protein [Alphaproteobacteria bacterium]MBQ9270991.1 hypothetical protein [Alphaproteobacteria bacterium]
MKLELNPFKRKIAVDPKVIERVADLATESYSNPFSELARVKIAARELLKDLKPIKGQKK